MPPERAHIHPDIAEHGKAALEPVSGISLIEKIGDVGAAFIAQPRFEIIANAFDIGAIALREIEFLQCRVQLDEG